MHRRKAAARRAVPTAARRPMKVMTEAWGQWPRAWGGCVAGERGRCGWARGRRSESCGGGQGAEGAAHGAGQGLRPERWRENGGHGR
eukprot:scaffold4367_cov119-Isochrysis_galbana.AAC.2